MNTYEYVYKLYRPYMNLNVIHKGTENEYRIGTYTFYHGVVDIYADKNYVTLTLVYEGYMHNKSFSGLKERMSDLKLAHQARIFANQIIKK